MRMVHTSLHLGPDFFPDYYHLLSGIPHPPPSERSSQLTCFHYGLALITNTVTEMSNVIKFKAIIYSFNRFNAQCKPHILIMMSLF